MKNEIIKDIILDSVTYDIIKKEFKYLDKNNICLRKERLEHIIEGHSDIGEDIPNILEKSIKNPSVILVDSKNTDTIMFIYKGDNNINVVVKLSIKEQFDNSIITAYRLSDKRLIRILEKHRTLYKNDSI